MKDQIKQILTNVLDDFAIFRGDDGEIIEQLLDEYDIDLIVQAQYEALQKANVLRKTHENTKTN